MDKSSMVECLINYYTDGNQAKFAAMLGIPAQNVSAWIKRGTFNAELLFEKLDGVSAEWLLTGEGEMLKSAQQQNVDIVLDKRDKELISLCKLLVKNYQQRDDIMGKLVSMVKGLWCCAICLHIF